MQKIWKLGLVGVFLAVSVATPTVANDLVNPDFATDLTGWDNPFFHDATDRSVWLGSDGGPLSGPGCLEEGTTFNNGGSDGLFQYVPVTVGETYLLSGWSRVPSTVPGNGATLWVDWMDGSDNVVGSGGVTWNFDAGGGWHYHYAAVTAPTGAVNARVRPSIQMVVGGTDESVARWDDLDFGPGLFRDGFETGDLSIWSAL